MRTARALSLLFLAALFLYAGLDKAFHYGGFVKALAGYVVVPAGLERHLALPVILTELLVGVGLLVRAWRSAAALVAAVLLSAFIVALAVNRQFAPGAECGCWFTVTLGKATGTHIFQNLILLGLAVTVWLEERRTAQVPLAPSLERSSS
ncbi:MAG TPA: MauE/DoxX family redox-associated membrane protein [Thermoanaerobaculia bacterium]|nr:MauE/DoxX family redox-associated membrane protein [Thermoanaerobaculia bacterium]